MTGHLPECCMNMTDAPERDGHCICDRLRACEARVRQEHSSVIHECPPTGSGLMPCCGRTPLEVSRTDRMTLERANVTCGRPFTKGFAAGVRAVRDAVDAAYDDERYAHEDDWGVPVVYRDLMLDAIDALKGEANE